MNNVGPGIPKKVSKHTTPKSIQSCKTVSQKKGKKLNCVEPPSSPQNFLPTRSKPLPQPKKLTRSSEYGMSSSKKIEGQKQSHRLISNDDYNKPPQSIQQKVSPSLPSPEYYSEPHPKNKKGRSSRSNSRQTIMNSNKLLQNLERRHQNQTKEISPSVNQREMHRLEKIQFLERESLKKKLGQSRESKTIKESKDKK